MPVVSLVQRGPFSYDELTVSAGQASESAARDFALTNSAFDSTIGEVLEVFVEGVKLVGSGLNATGDEFTVDTNATKITIVTDSALAAATGSAVTALAESDVILIRRVSDRTTKKVDFAPGSIIREADLDNANTQVFHVAQEAMDIALKSIALDLDNKWEASTDSTNRVIKNVADGSADNDAVNMSQMTNHNETTLAYKEDTEDYKLETADWAQKVNGGVQVYDANSPTGGALGFSAKAHAIGGTDVTGASGQGSAKDWAVGAGGVMATKPDGTEYSAKEYSQGTTVATGSAKQWATKDTTAVASSLFSAKEYASGISATGGTSKEWAQKTDGAVDSEFSAKAHASLTTSSAPSTGSAKEWAIGGEGVISNQPDGSEYSAKEYAQGSTATGGTAKEWATQDTTAVASSLFSAKEYASGTSATGGTAKEWAQKSDGVVDTEFSAKAYASVTGANAPTDGSAKEWSTVTGAVIADSEYSSKEYASGSTVTTGSSKEWATNAGSAEVQLGQGYSSKAYAQNTGDNIGSAKDWATLATQVASTDWSSKSYAQDTSNNIGSAKDWATKTSAFVNSVDGSAKAWAIGGTGVDTGDGSSKDWATKASGTVGSSSLKSAKQYADSVSTKVDELLTLTYLADLGSVADSVATSSDYGSITS